MTSIKIFSWLSILLLFNISCNNTKNKDNINGNWEFVSITPTKSTSRSESAEVAANIWLNVLSSNSILKFQNDSLFLNNHFLSTYIIDDKFITLNNKENESETYELIFKENTIKLISNDSDRTIITLKKNSP